MIHMNCYEIHALKGLRCLKSKSSVCFNNQISLNYTDVTAKCSILMLQPSNTLCEYMKSTCTNPNFKINVPPKVVLQGAVTIKMGKEISSLNLEKILFRL